MAPTDSPWSTETVISTSPPSPLRAATRAMWLEAGAGSGSGSEAHIPLAEKDLGRMRPSAGHEQFQLHCFEPLLLSVQFSEPHQLAADAETASFKGRGQHSELAHTFIELLDPDASDDIPVHPRRRSLSIG